MKKISLILSMVLFTLLITSCETEISVQDNNDFQKSATFDAETTYWSILGNTENGMDQFDALTNEQKQAVWVFKYDRFIADNTLTADQLAAINLAKDYVSTVDFSAEPNETNLNSIESQLAAEFDEDTKSFLVLTLENNAIDIGEPGNGSQYQTQGCFWCYDPIGEAGDCCAYRDPTDNSIVDYRRPQTYRVRRLWIGFKNKEGFVACDQNAWISDGSSDCTF